MVEETGEPGKNRLRTPSQWQLSHMLWPAPLAVKEDHHDINAHERRTGKVSSSIISYSMYQYVNMSVIQMQTRATNVHVRCNKLICVIKYLASLWKDIRLPHFVLF